MNLELPEENELPLKIQESSLIIDSGESEVWKTTVDTPNNNERDIVLKQNHEHSFASMEEMMRSKRYYEYLKNFPGFGKFILNTLYFTARQTKNDLPSAYCIQQFLPGRTINLLPDEELENDPEVKKELLEFVDAAVDIIRATREEGKIKPDFGKSHDEDTYGHRMANIMLNPRYSNNILVTDTPDENGRRVFFVDTGENFGERTRPIWEKYQRQVIGRIQEYQLKKLRKELS